MSSLRPSAISLTTSTGSLNPIAFRVPLTSSVVNRLAEKSHPVDPVPVEIIIPEDLNLPM